MTPSERALLVVGPAWVGDMVMAQSLFKALKREDEDAAIDIVAPPGVLTLTERMPELRDSFSLPVGHGELRLGTRLAVARRLRSRSYQRAIVLPSSFKSALLPFFARVPIRTGYRGEWRYGLINDLRTRGAFDSEENVRGYLGLGGASQDPGPAEIARPALRVDRENQDRLVEGLGLELDRPVVALSPGAAHGPAKRWPVEHFRELARRLSAEAYAVWVLGGESDRALGDAVLEGAGGRAHNLCGRTTLPDAVDLLNLARLTVANDSGLMHVAAAAGSRVVALFGPTPPTFAPPLTDKANILYLAIECSPCFARTCPLGHHRCLRDISVEDVLATVLESV